MADHGLTLCDRLRALRADALRQLGASDRLDGGLLRLVADAGAVLSALDEPAVAALVPEHGARVVLLDDNQQITLAVFSGDRQSSAATLNPTVAIRLGNQL